jgi:glycosyltransferase involved in cell wall biosynthesis
VFAALSVTDDESFGVAMIEASACARPVVSTRVGGVPEVVRDGETGILVPPRDIAAAAGALESLARSPELRHRMGRAGREFVVDTYDWNTTAERMRAIYLEVGARGE